MNTFVKLIQLPQYHTYIFSLSVNTPLLLLLPLSHISFPGMAVQAAPKWAFESTGVENLTPPPPTIRPHTPPPPRPRLFNVSRAVGPLVSALFLSTSHSKQMVKSASGRRRGKNLIRGPRAPRSSHLNPSPAEFISILTAPRGTGVTERDQMFCIHHMFSYGYCMIMA